MKLKCAVVGLELSAENGPPRDKGQGKKDHQPQKSLEDKNIPQYFHKIQAEVLPKIDIRTLTKIDKGRPSLVMDNLDLREIIDLLSLLPDSFGKVNVFIIHEIVFIQVFYSGNQLS